MDATDAGLVPTIALESSTHGQVNCLVFTYRRTSRAKDDPSTHIKVEWATALTGPWMEADGTHGEIISVE